MPDEALEILQQRLARYEGGNTGAVTEPLALAEAMAAMDEAFVFHDPSGELEFDLEILEACLLYTSDAADDLLCVDLGGRRIIKKKKKKKKEKISQHNKININTSNQKKQR